MKNEEIQKKTFEKWINSVLGKSSCKDLYTDLRDGIILLELLEHLTERKIVKEFGKSRVHHLGNFYKIFSILQENSVSIDNYNSEEFLDGNSDKTLNLVWSIISRWHFSCSHKNVNENSLLAWSQKCCPELNIVDFTVSWTNGLAFSGILSHFYPQFLNSFKIESMTPKKRLQFVFKSIETHLNVFSLLDPKDFESSLDKKSIMMYVMSLFTATCKVGENNENSILSLSQINSCLSYEEYTIIHNRCKDWLDEAETKICSLEKLPRELEDVKKFFENYKVLMDELDQNKEFIFQVISKGEELLKNSERYHYDTNELQKRIQLLDERWQALRTSAMNRQTEILELLMTRQREKLIQFKDWMTDMENRISRVGPIGSNLALVHRQKGEIESLRQDVENQQSVVSLLSHFILTETNESIPEHELEEELNALSRRWTELCEWVEDRCSTMERVIPLWTSFIDKKKAITDWITRNEELLRRNERNETKENVDELGEQENQINIIMKEIIKRQKTCRELKTLSEELLDFYKAPTNDDISESLLVLRDRLELLTQIVKGQKSRISESKNKTKIHVNGVGDQYMAVPHDLQALNMTEKYQDSYFNVTEDGVLSNFPLKICEGNFVVSSNKKEKEIFRVTEEEKGDNECLSDVTNLVFELKSRLPSLIETSHDISNSISPSSSSSFSGDDGDEKKFIKNVDDLHVWMKEVCDSLEKSEEPAFEDLNKLEKQISESNVLLNNIQTLEYKVVEINDFGATLLQKTFSNTIECDLQTINSKWKKITKGSQEQNLRYRDAFTISSSLLDSIREIESFLQGLHFSPESKTLKQSSDVSELNFKLLHLKDRIEKKKLDYDKLQEKIKQHSIFISRFQLLRWTEHVTPILSYYQSIKVAFTQIGEFKSLAALQKDLLERFEKKLLKSSNSAADAEEISEELDDIENFMNQSSFESRLTTLKELLLSLEKANIDIDDLRNEKETLEKNWEALYIKAKERTDILENSIIEAQEWECKILSVQDWLTERDIFLSSQLEQELCLHDFPDETMERILREFEDHENILAEMDEQVDAYRNAGKVEAANRLEDQLNLIHTRFQELSMKFESFQSQSPIEYKSRLCRVSRQLSDIGRQITLLEFKTWNSLEIEELYHSAKCIHNALLDVKPEVDNVIQMGRIVVEKSFETPKMANELTLNIDNLKNDFHNVEFKIVESKAQFEKALYLSERLTTKFNSLSQNWPKLIFPEESKEKMHSYLKSQIEILSKTKEKMEAIQGISFDLFTITGKTRDCILQSRIRELEEKWKALSTVFIEKFQIIDKEYNCSFLQLKDKSSLMTDDLSLPVEFKHKFMSLSKAIHEIKEKLSESEENNLSSEIEDLEPIMSYLRENAIKLSTTFIEEQENYEPKMKRLEKEWNELLNKVDGTNELCIQERTKSESKKKEMMSRGRRVILDSEEIITLAEDSENSSLSLLESQQSFENLIKVQPQNEVTKVVMVKTQSLPKPQRVCMTLSLKPTFLEIPQCSQAEVLSISTTNSNENLEEDIAKEHRVIDKILYTTHQDLEEVRNRKYGKIKNSLQKESNDFESRCRSMISKIEKSTLKLNEVDKESDLILRIDLIDMEVKMLEAQVETLISHGDSLVLLTRRLDTYHGVKLQSYGSQIKEIWKKFKFMGEGKKLSIMELESQRDSFKNDSKALYDLLQSQKDDKILGEKKDEVERINILGNHLKENNALKSSESLLLNSINSTWSQRCPLNVEQTTALELLTRINKLRDAIDAINKQFNLEILNTLKPFDNLSSQLSTLHTIKSAIDRLKTNIRKTETDVETLSAKGLSVEVYDKLTDVNETLRREWEDLVRRFHERLKGWTQASEQYNEFKEKMKIIRQIILVAPSEPSFKLRDETKTLVSLSQNILGKVSSGEALLLKAELEALLKEVESSQQNSLAPLSVNKSEEFLNLKNRDVDNKTALKMTKAEVWMDECNSTLEKASKRLRSPSASEIISRIRLAVINKDYEINQIITECSEKTHPRLCQFVEKWNTLTADCRRISLEDFGPSEFSQREELPLESLQEYKNYLVTVEKDITIGAHNSSVQDPESVREQIGVLQNILNNLEIKRVYFTNFLMDPKLYSLWNSVKQQVLTQKTNMLSKLGDSEVFIRKSSEIHSSLKNMSNKYQELTMRPSSATQFTTMTTNSLDSRLQNLMHLQKEVDSYEYHLDTFSSLCNRICSLYGENLSSLSKEVRDEYQSLSFTIAQEIDQYNNTAQNSVSSSHISINEFQNWISQTETNVKKLSVSGSMRDNSLNDIKKAMINKDRELYSLLSKEPENQRIVELNRQMKSLQNTIMDLSIGDPKALLIWISEKQNEFDTKKKLANDIINLQAQIDEHCEFRNELETVSGDVDKYTAQISGELSSSLKEKMRELRTTSCNWNSTLEDRLLQMTTFKTNVETINSRLTAVEEVSSPSRNEEIESHLTELEDGLVCLKNQADKLSGLSSSTTEQLITLEDRISHLRQDFSHTDDLPPHWEKRFTDDKIPYFLNHQTSSTTWDHPLYTELMNSLLHYNTIKYSVYRLSLKLRRIQQKCSLDLLDIETVLVGFESFGLGAPRHDLLLNVSELTNILQSFMTAVNEDSKNTVNIPLSVSLLLNWFLNVYDPLRQGCIRFLAFKIGLLVLTRGPLGDKYQVLFDLVSKEEMLHHDGLGHLLFHCLQIPKALGEIVAFGGSNVEPSVRSCFTKDDVIKNKITAKEFHDWLRKEPQSLVWLPVLHRLAWAEVSKHNVRCSICKTSPLTGFRYHCLKCFNVDLCSNCFFLGKTLKNHSSQHPMKEYCTSTGTSQNLKHFTSSIRNSFRSKKYFKKKIQKLGYLPVNAVFNDEDGCQEENSSDPSSSREGSTMESLLPKTLTLRELESFEDEHALIATYCQSLLLDYEENKSPLHLLEQCNNYQREDLEEMIETLVDENKHLLTEYNELLETKSVKCNGNEIRLEDEVKQETNQCKRMEIRMKILEDHNQKLDAQLQLLRHFASKKIENTAAAPHRI